MTLGELGEQVVIKSRKAFDRLGFIRAIPAENETYYPLRTTRDRRARDEFRREKSSGTALDEVYIVDIIRNGWKNDDTRLRRDLP